jgi:glycerophosphoryl diester phosphodiesterase
MDSTRRTVIAATGALALAGCRRHSVVTVDLPPPVRLPDVERPIIIAHRGASGYRPEHTLSAYQLAIDQGANVIEPDLVITKDGHLVARHENEIGGTTDVADRPVFASRRREQIIDGERFEGWFVEDFTLDELKSLRCKERLPQLRPANRAFDGKDTIPTLDEVVALALAAGRPVGIYPETKHPTHHEHLGLSFDAALKASVAPVLAAGGAVFVQSFEVGNLQRMASPDWPVTLVQLVSAEGGPADLPDVTYADMITPAGLADIARYAGGLGPQKTLILPRDGQGRSQQRTTLVAAAHGVGLKVHPWTLRAENVFLPAELQRGPADDPAFQRLPGDMLGEARLLLEAGADGLFCDHPDLGVAALKAFMAGHPA